MASLQRIGKSIAATLGEITLGFLAGAGSALVIGALLARWRVAELVLSPYLVAAQTMPIHMVLTWPIRPMTARLVSGAAE